MKKPNHILITGGEGFIGRSIGNFLIKKNKNIISIDNLSNSEIKNHNKKIIFYKADLRNVSKIEKIFKKYNFETIIHLSAKINARESNLKKKKYYLNNYLYGKNLVKIAKKYNSKYFIFSSSAAIYGSYKKKFKENDQKKPINVYGKYKLLFENFLKKEKIIYANLRFFNICGADVKLKIGQKKNLSVVKKICFFGENKKTFNIFGNNFDTKDGSSVRDYIHIKDLNNIIHKTMNYLRNYNRPVTLNCGTGKGISTYELIKSYNKLTKKKLKIKITQEFSGDPPEVIANISKLYKLLGYKPKYSTVDKIIKSSINWENFLKKY